MALPTYKVEVAFNAGPNVPDSARIWTDVTAYALLSNGAEITAGRGDWRSTADANRLRVTLNNSDGRFTAEVERTNYAPEPSVENATTEWVQHSGGVTSVTWARQTGWAYEGSYSMRQTGTSGTTTLPNGLKGYIGSLVIPGGFAYPATPGQTWTVRGQANVLTVPNGAGDPGLWAEIFYFDAALALIVQNNGPSVFQRVPLGVQTLTCTATAPASTAWMQAAFVMGTAQSSSVMDWYLDSARAEIAGAPVSPYYPGVKMGRPIRVTATLGGVTTTRYVGFIDEWPLEWPSVVPTFATASITASSRMAWMGNGMELRSVIEQEILGDEPIAYYTLGESAGATQANDSSGNNAPALVQTGTGAAVVFGNATGPGTDGLTAAQFAGGKYLSGSVNAGLANRGITLIAAINVTSLPSNLAPAVCLPFSTSGGIWITPDQVNGLHLGGWRPPGGGALTEEGVAGTYTVGQTTVVAIAVDSTGTTVSTYQDGALLGTDTWGTMPNDTISGILLGGNQIYGTSTTLVQPSCVLAHAAIIATELNATQIAAVSNAMLNGFAGETPTARLTRYASYVGIAASELNFETGMVADLAHIDTTGRAALDCMRTVEATEEGVLFDHRDGDLTFHARNHRYSAASAFTLDVAAKHVDIGVSPRLDRTVLRNDVSAQSIDGTIAARATNAASINDYGVARESLDLATSDSEEPFQHASWLVNQYGTPRPRVPQLGVKLANLPTTLALAVLAAGVGTRFTVRNMPNQAAVSTQDYYIEGYTETIGAGVHDFVFNVSQAEPFNVWTVEDATYGAFDSNPIAL